MTFFFYLRLTAGALDNVAKESIPPWSVVVTAPQGPSSKLNKLTSALPLSGAFHMGLLFNLDVYYSLLSFLSYPLLYQYLLFPPTSFFPLSSLLPTTHLVFLSRSPKKGSEMPKYWCSCVSQGVYWFWFSRHITPVC